MLAMSLKSWQEKVWIHPDDPRGWSNSIAVIIMDVDYLKRIEYKSKDEKPSKDMLGQLKRTVKTKIKFVERNKDKRYFTGHMIVEKFR